MQHHHWVPTGHRHPRFQERLSHLVEFGEELNTCMRSKTPCRKYRCVSMIEGRLWYLYLMKFVICCCVVVFTHFDMSSWLCCRPSDRNCVLLLVGTNISHLKTEENQPSSHLARGPVRFHRVYYISINYKQYGKLHVRCTSSVRTLWRKWLQGFFVVSMTKAAESHATLLDTLSLKPSLSPLTSFSRNTRLNSAKWVASYKAL